MSTPNFSRRPNLFDDELISTDKLRQYQEASPLIVKSDPSLKQSTNLEDSAHKPSCNQENIPPFACEKKESKDTITRSVWGTQRPYPVSSLWTQPLQDRWKPWTSLAEPEGEQLKSENNENEVKEEMSKSFLGIPLSNSCVFGKVINGEPALFSSAWEGLKKDQNQPSENLNLNVKNLFDTEISQKLLIEEDGQEKTNWNFHDFRQSIRMLQKEDQSPSLESLQESIKMGHDESLEHGENLLSMQLEISRLKEELKNKRESEDSQEDQATPSEKRKKDSLQKTSQCKRKKKEKRQNKQDESADSHSETTNSSFVTPKKDYNQKKKTRRDPAIIEGMVYLLENEFIKNPLRENEEFRKEFIRFLKEQESNELITSMLSEKKTIERKRGNENLLKRSYEAFRKNEKESNLELLESVDGRESVTKKLKK